jgi:hypothetical protein
VNDWFGSQTFTIGIIGGGRGGHGLLEFFRQSEGVKLAYIVDPNSSAPAMVAAKGAGIPTFSDAMTALAGPLPDFLFDSTGDPVLEGQIKLRIRDSATRLVSPATSRMMVRVMDENRLRVREGIAVIVGQIKAELSDSLEGSHQLVARINQIMSNMQMLSLNASIEAAKAGTLGRGFAVVADHMGRSVETVRKVTQEIDGVNGKIIRVGEEIDSVLEQLK